MVEDPVCGMELDEDQVVARSDYQGQSYFFCSDECCAMFEAEPERYIGMEALDYQPHNYAL